MASQIKVVAGNTAPFWQLTCQRDNVAINLTGCTIAIRIAKGNVITQAAGACTILDASNGIIKYVPVSSDVPLAGTYKVDVRVTYGDGSLEVLYDQLKVKARSPL